MMRALFIDFDGVLQPYPPRAGLSQMCWLPLLAELLETHPDVVLVVHASMREHSPPQFIRGLLGKIGWRLHGVAPRGPRWPAIQSYLASHPELRRYLVLDDMASEFPRPAPPDLLLCNGTTGITAPAVRDSLCVWLCTDSRVGCD